MVCAHFRIESEPFESAPAWVECIERFGFGVQQKVGFEIWGRIGFMWGHFGSDFRDVGIQNIRLCFIITKFVDGLKIEISDFPILSQVGSFWDGENDLAK